ncbi:MAG TPA: A/G-specific adenine glycosylase [Actinopolymorphaceae bacterium]|jgi:A/G-specific adenine glycosylase
MSDDRAGAPNAGWLRRRIGSWYDQNARELPWRPPEVTPWGVLVSEIMLQQTPVARVLPIWTLWLQRWPTPAALAAEEPAAAIRAWARLGYPRRALRLHAAARAIDDLHDGAVPEHEDVLRSLPGIGEYTAAAVAAFAFRRRSVVLDTNVRRVLGRVLRGEALPSPAVTNAERAEAAALVPADGPAAAHWAVAVMELGALVCTARAPDCAVCPVRTRCRWFEAGQPEAQDRPRTQGYEGTDRQARGQILAILRGADDPVPPSDLEPEWPPAEQRDRALASLLADGLVVLDNGDYRLP